MSLLRALKLPSLETLAKASVATTTAASDSGAVALMPPAATSGFASATALASTMIPIVISVLTAGRRPA